MKRVHRCSSASLGAVALHIMLRKCPHMLVGLCISVHSDLLAAHLHVRLCCPN